MRMQCAAFELILSGTGKSLRCALTGMAQITTYLTAIGSKVNLLCGYDCCHTGRKFAQVPAVIWYWQEWAGFVMYFMIAVALRVPVYIILLHHQMAGWF